MMVQGAGFEPAKHLAPELKSGPFDRSGTPATGERGLLHLNRAQDTVPN